MDDGFAKVSLVAIELEAILEVSLFVEETKTDDDEDTLEVADEIAETAEDETREMSLRATELESKVEVALLVEEI